MIISEKDLEVKQLRFLDELKALLDKYSVHISKDDCPEPECDCTYCNCTGEECEPDCVPERKCDPPLSINFLVGIKEEKKGEFTHTYRPITYCDEITINQIESAIKVIKRMGTIKIGQQKEKKE